MRTALPYLSFLLSLLEFLQAGQDRFWDQSSHGEICRLWKSRATFRGTEAGRWDLTQCQIKLWRMVCKGEVADKESQRRGLFIWVGSVSSITAVTLSNIPWMCYMAILLPKVTADPSLSSISDVTRTKHCAPRFTFLCRNLLKHLSCHI